MTRAAKLTERFRRYVDVESQSDARAASLPSTPGQQRLAHDPTTENGDPLHR